MTDLVMNCDRLDAVLADYLEGDLDARTRAAVEGHAGECLRCASLLRDVQRISADAAQLGALEPSRDLWPGIAARIEAPVIPLAPAAPLAARSGARRALWFGAAAAALVVISVGTTYTVMMGRMARAAGNVVVQTRTPSDIETVGQLTAPVVSPAPSTPVASGSTASTAATLNQQIAQLKDVLEQRRARLDPATVAVVESSLLTIDRAITDARTALASDPASAFLTDQLNNALEKKLGLLRTVALLPPRL